MDEPGNWATKSKTKSGVMRLPVLICACLGLVPCSICACNIPWFQKPGHQHWFPDTPPSSSACIVQFSDVWLSEGYCTVLCGACTVLQMALRRTESRRSAGGGRDGFQGTGDGFGEACLGHTCRGPRERTGRPATGTD